MDRKDLRSINKVIDECANVFKEDHSLLVFPEGTRTSGNELGKFGSAILEVAYKTFVPIVPVCIFGTDGFLAKDKNEKPKYHIGEIVIDALEPIRSSEYMNWSRQYLADVLRDRIQQRYNL
ncbi:1-acyl-sn-glycerol-3-phosphate acyltransferase [bacterium]|nr:1-acyl-sn-glycerol-3-phosphate acyltransferase [bacterium]